MGCSPSKDIQYSHFFEAVVAPEQGVLMEADPDHVCTVEKGELFQMELVLKMLQEIGPENLMRELLQECASIKTDLLFLKHILEKDSLWESKS